jgi:hypothetical protein
VEDLDMVGKGRVEGGQLSVKTLEWAVKTYLPLSTEFFCLSLKLGGERGNGGSGGGHYFVHDGPS